MPGWPSHLLGETRLRILRLLRRSPETVTALAATVGLTDNGVRIHLAALERDGLVEDGGIARDTGGKPARIYRLSQAGEEFFPKAYAFVLDRLLDQIGAADGSERVVELLEAVGRRAAGEQRPGPKDTEGRVHAAVRCLRDLGGDVEVERVAGGWKLQGHGCPLSSVTKSHPEACSLVRALVEGIAERPVAECCERGERPRCAFRVEE